MFRLRKLFYQSFEDFLNITLTKSGGVFLRLVQGALSLVGFELIDF